MNPNSFIEDWNFMSINKCLIANKKDKMHWINQKHIFWIKRNEFIDLNFLSMRNVHTFSIYCIWFCCCWAKYATRLSIFLLSRIVLSVEHYCSMSTADIDSNCAQSLEKKSNVFFSLFYGLESSKFKDK